MRVLLRPTTSFARFAEYPKAFWFLFIGMLINGIATFVLPFESIYLVADRHLPVAQAATIVGVYGIGSCLAALVGGLLADTIGRRPTILIGLFCLTATTFGLAFVSETWLIALLTFLMGFWISWYRPASNAVIADLVPQKEQARANGLMYWAYNIGMAISPVLASVIVGKSGYVLLFCIDGCGTLLFWVLMLLGLPETQPVVTSPAHPHQRKAAEGAHSTQGTQRTRSVWRDLPFLCFVVLSFVLTSIYFQNASTLPVDMQLHGLDASQYGMAIAVNGIVVVLLGLPLSHLLAKAAPFRALAISALFLGIGFGLTTLADTLLSLPAYMGSIAVWTIGEIIFVPVSATVVALFSPASRRGTYQGVARLSWGLSACVGPLVGGLILQSWSASLWIGCVALGVLVACGFVLIGRQSAQRQTNEEDQMEVSEANAIAIPDARQEKTSEFPLHLCEDVDSPPMPTLVLSPETEVYQAKCVETSTGDKRAN